MRPTPARGRGVAVREVAKEAGKSAATIGRWVRLYSENPRALVVKRRADKGRPRVVVSRAFDAADMGLAPEVKAQVVKEFLGHVKGWVQRGARKSEVLATGPGLLARLCREAGATMPDRQLGAACRFSRAMVDRWHKEQRSVWLKEQRNKAYGDKHEFRAQGEHPKLPWHTVQLDIHNVDVLHAGRVAEIAFRCVATGLKRSRHVIRRNGRDVTGADVLAALHDVVTELGIMRVLKVDNGSNIKVIGRVLREFAALAGGGGYMRVETGRTYLGQAKPQLERSFETGKRVTTGQPGFTDGDWWNTPEKARGVKIDPWPHGDEALLAKLAEKVVIQNGTATPALGGCPNEVFERLARETGWEPMKITSRAFDLIAHEEAKEFQVRNGHVWNGGVGYTNVAADVMARQVGRSVRVLKPLRSGANRAFVIADGIEHEVTVVTFDRNDPQALALRDAMAEQQDIEIARRKEQGNPDADRMAEMYRQARKEPPQIGDGALWDLQPGAIARRYEPAEEAPDPAPSAQEAEFSQRLRNHRAARADAIRADEVFDA